MNQIKNQFTQNFKWNIFGSFFYESTKILNQISLLKIMSTQEYGLFATTFSIIYFVIYLAELGITQSLPVFISLFARSKYNFKNIFLKLYLLPQIPIFILVAIIGTFFYRTSFLLSPKSPYVIILPLIIIFEGLRIFLRRFLHNILITKKTVILESLLMSIYLSIVWIPYIIFSKHPTLNRIFGSYLITSMICVIFFSIFIYSFYKKLPSKSAAPIQRDFYKKIIKTRWLNYSINVTKSFFNGNFLTPFFAANFGFTEAGIFNFANHIAESIKAITKSTVFFSGSGLFVKIKTDPIKIKRKAFKLLFQKLNQLIYPIFIFIIINHHFIFLLKNADLAKSASSMALLFFVITAADFFFMPYELFYIVEEKVGKLFIFKLIEMLLFYIVITSKILQAPVLILIGLILVKLVSFFILALNAYTKWKLRPCFKINVIVLLSAIVLSVVFYYLQSFGL